MNHVGQDLSNPDTTRTQTCSSRRGYKLCNRCFTYSHVRRRNCRNCELPFQAVRKTKKTYEVCELTGLDKRMRLFSLIRTLHGLPSRGFVCFDCERLTWTCFCCSNSGTLMNQMNIEKCINASTCINDQLGKVDSIDSSSLLQSSSPSNKDCAHIISCKTCDRTAIPLSIDNESINAILPEIYALNLFGRIRQNINLFHPVIFRTSFTSFAVSCLPEDFNLKSNKPEKYIGYLHTCFIENKQEQRKYSSCRKLRFSCQCEFYKTYSKIELKLRTEIIQCVHYYLALAAILGNQNLREYFSAFDLRTGHLLREGDSSQLNSCLAMIPASSLKLANEKDMHRTMWSFTDWLKSIEERINDTVYPTNYTRVQTLKFHVCLNFMSILREKLDRCVIPQVHQLNEHPSTHLNGIFYVYTWTFMSVEQLQDAFKDVECIRYFEIANNNYLPLKEEGLDFNALEGRLVRCMIDFEDPMTIKWVESISKISLYSDLDFTFSFRRDLYG